MVQVVKKVKHKLTDAQRELYANEIGNNFRFVSCLLASRSSIPLTRSQRASPELQTLLHTAGRFAEAAVGVLDTRFIWSNLDVLLQEGYPCEGFDALRGSTLVQVFWGKVASLQGYVAYRPEERQAVVAFSGTCTVLQSLHDLDARRVRYPVSTAGQSEENLKGDAKFRRKKTQNLKPSVHAGFWRMYKGLRESAFKGLSTCVENDDVQEILITGHSLGAVQAYLFAMDFLQIMLGYVPDTYNLGIKPGICIKLLGFGCPRVGNKALACLFEELVSSYRSNHGEDTLIEHCVRNYTDGANDLPPKIFGYSHVSLAPLYEQHGHLYHIPSSKDQKLDQRQYTAFPVEVYEDEGDLVPDFPKGGHNYYNNRDMLRAVCRFHEMRLEEGVIGWKERYEKWLNEKRATKSEGPERR